MTIQEEKGQTEENSVEGIPGNVRDNDESKNATSRVFANELMPSDADRPRFTEQTTACRIASAHHLADGFSKSDQLKILYLYQCFKLQKILRTKLNRFGRNQITRYNGPGIKRRVGASNSQRYPLPCCTHFFILLLRAAAPKGTMSCRTRGRISVCPLKNRS